MNFYKKNYEKVNGLLLLFVLDLIVLLVSAPFWALHIFFLIGVALTLGWIDGILITKYKLLDFNYQNGT